MRVFQIVSLFILLALVVSACGGAPTPDPVNLTIDMKEFTFEPAVLQLRVGQQVTLDLTNSGQLPHEIMFGRDVMMMDNKPSGYQTDMFHEAGVTPTVNVVEPGREVEGVSSEEDEHAGFMVVVDPEGHSQMTFTVTEGMVGEWEMGCFEQDGVHYTAGMKGPVTISQ